MQEPYRACINGGSFSFFQIYKKYTNCKLKWFSPLKIERRLSNVTDNSAKQLHKIHPLFTN